MRRLRRALGPLAAVWLVWQAGTLVFVPTALWVGVALADTSECTCAHGDHAICPMHHNSAGRSRICVLQNAHDDGLAVLSSLLGHVGLVPVPTRTVAPLSGHAVILIDITTSSLRPAPPDPPPPRA